MNDADSNSPYEADDTAVVPSDPGSPEAGAWPSTTGAWPASGAPNNAYPVPNAGPPPAAPPGWYPPSGYGSAGYPGRDPRAYGPPPGGAPPAGYGAPSPSSSDGPAEAGSPPYGSTGDAGGPPAGPSWGGAWPPPPPDAGGQGPRPGWGGGGWNPPPGGPPNGWPGGGPWGPPQYGSPRRRRGALSAVLLTAALVAGAAALGVGIGHEAWSNNQPVNSSANSPSGNTYNPYSGGNGYNPYSGGNGFNPGSGSSGSGSSGSGSSGSGSGSTGNASGGPSDVGAITAKVQGGLVDINTDLTYQDAAAAGTGIVLTSKGEMLTNNHVIDGATPISVTDIGNGKTYTASVVGYDSTHDIAVLQMKGASGLTTAKIGDSSSLAVGQSVVGIGNAEGAGGPPSSAGGSITALNQSISADDSLDGSSEQLSGLIQTNADIQPGDSGGPLVNTSGVVIGIDTAASDGFSFQSGAQAFAIPIDQAVALEKQIVAGTASADVHIGATAFIGVTVAIDNANQTVPGAMIESVVSGGAASQAGIVPGDVITSVAGQTITSASQVAKILVPLHPGDRISIGWTDTSGQTHTATATLTEGPPA